MTHINISAMLQSLISRISMTLAKGLPTRVGPTMLLIVIVALVPVIAGWRMWTNDGDGIGDAGPGGRVGHTMVLDENGSRVILFGGRDNDIVREHVPKTYEVTRTAGTLEFVSYDEKIVLECQENALARSKSSGVGSSSDNAGSTSTSTGASASTVAGSANESPGDTCSVTVPVGLYYNDVWEYNLNCTRFANGPCEGSGWSVLHEGATHGGCEYVRGTEICKVPSERWRHGAAMFDDETMIVYGGYSQRCGDYCDDAWSFDLRDNTWMEIYPLGHFSEGKGPGKRWRFSVAYDGVSMMIFGGHRLWHGFATDNAQENAWSSFSQYSKGGFLDDLWIYSKKILDADEQVPTDSSDYGEWTQLEGKQYCVADPGVAWEDRNDISCQIRWPQARAGHAAVWDEERRGMWLYGGYTTFFPYMSSDGAGSGYGTTALGRGGFRPYPDYPYYLSDMWFFNTTSGQWIEVQSTSPTNPTPRMDHVMVRVNDILVVFGGFYFNHHYDDTWFFNMTTSYWLEKTTHVHPVYSTNCTDDLAFIDENNCTELSWPKILERDTSAPWDISPFEGQAYYHPDPEFGPFYGVHGQGEIGSRQGSAGFLKGSPLPPYMSTAPRQYLRSYVHDLNATHNATLFEWCTSVYGEPTRAMSMSVCASNCSFHGECHNGYCSCHDGFYGLDCSNTSCPGDFCYYDETSHVEICSHCCQAGWTHRGGDTYVTEDVFRSPCSASNPGESHGICDGFGTCQCAPPFIGDDCSIKDCSLNCSFNGWCSVEFPVSRCICHPGYYGDHCQYLECLNNCSYPHGICDNRTGICECEMTYSPYNNMREWFAWMGEDCSYLVAFAGARREVSLPTHAWWWLWSLLAALSLVLALDGPLLDVVHVASPERLRP